MSKSRAIGRHASSSSGWRATEIDAALHQDPRLADAAAPELVRQREAARRMMPEQIVGDEDVVADRAKSLADGVDRSLAHRSRVQLPDRAERAAERTAARRFDQPGRTMRETGVLPAPAIDVVSGRQRHVVERERRRCRPACGSPRRRRRAAQAGHRRERPPRSSASHECAARALAVVEHDRVDIAR